MFCLTLVTFLLILHEHCKLFLMLKVDLYSSLLPGDISVFDEDNDIAVMPLNYNSMQQKWDTIA